MQRRKGTLVMRTGCKTDDYPDAWRPPGGPEEFCAQIGAKKWSPANGGRKADTHRYKVGGTSPLAAQTLTVYVERRSLRFHRFTIKRGTTRVPGAEFHRKWMTRFAHAETVDSAELE